MIGHVCFAGNLQDSIVSGERLDQQSKHEFWNRAKCEGPFQEAFPCVGWQNMHCWLNVLLEAMTAGEKRFRHDEKKAGAPGRIEGDSHGNLPATSGPAMAVCREERFEHDDLEAGAEIAQTNFVWCNCHTLIPRESISSE